MHLIAKLLLLVVALLMLVSCISAYQTSTQKVMIAEEVTFELIPTIPFDNGLRLTQSAQASYNNQNHDLIFETEILDQQLVMVGLTPTGTRLFTVQMQNQLISATGYSAMIDQIKPEYLLADLQLSLWPFEDITRAISGAKVTQPSSTQRRITKAGIDIITIEYSENPAYKGSVYFQHHQRGYSLRIEPLSIREVTNQAQEKQPHDH